MRLPLKWIRSRLTSRTGAEGEAAPKIPTLINYTGADGKKFAWGASVDRMQENIVGVKLMLDPAQERPLYLPTSNMKRTMRKLPKPAVNIAADFIGAVYNHALGEIAKVVPKDYFAICQRQYVLSVPAVWSDKAKNATLQVTFCLNYHDHAQEVTQNQNAVLTIFATHRQPS